MAGTFQGVANALIQAIDNSSLFSVGNGPGLKSKYLANVVSNGSANALTLATAIYSTFADSQYFAQFNTAWTSTIAVANTADDVANATVAMINNSEHWSTLKTSFIVSAE